VSHIRCKLTNFKLYRLYSICMYWLFSPLNLDINISYRDSGYRSGALWIYKRVTGRILLMKNTCFHFTLNCKVLLRKIVIRSGYFQGLVVDKI